MANNSDLPTWVIVISSLLVALGGFWEKIKSSFDKIIIARKTAKAKKNNLDMGEIKGLQNEIANLRKELRVFELETIRLKSSLNALIPIIREILKKNPEFQFLINTLQEIVNEKNKNESNKF